MTSRHYSLPGTSLRNSFRLWSSSDKRNAGAESDSEREREKDRSRHHRASLQHPSSSARDPRHSFSSSRPTATYPGVVQGSSQYAQEPPSSRVAVAPSHRPPSASGYKQSYRDHQPSGNKEPYPASSSTGMPPLSHQSNLASAAASPSSTVKPPAAGVGRTPSTSSPGAAVPTAPPLGTVPSSSSSTKQKESDGRTVFSRMFSRRRATSSTTPQVAPTAGATNASGSGDKDKSRSGKHQRSNSMQAAVPSYSGATVASSSSPPHIEPPTIVQPQPSTWTQYEQSAPTPKPTNYSTARDSEREERTKLRKDKDRHRDRDREREEQQQHFMMREERARMERSREERARQEYVASRRTDPTKSSRTERPSTSRRERERDGLMSDSDARAYDSSDSTRRRHLAAAASSGAVPSMSHRHQRSDDIAGLGSSHTRFSVATPNVPTGSSSSAPLSAQQQFVAPTPTSYLSPNATLPNSGVGVGVPVRDVMATPVPATTTRHPPVAIQPSTSSSQSRSSASGVGVGTAAGMGYPMRATQTSGPEERERDRGMSGYGKDEREREREKARDREWDRPRDRDREREGGKEKERERERDRDKERSTRDRDRHRESDRERERERDKENFSRSTRHRERSHRDKTVSLPPPATNAGNGGYVSGLLSGSDTERERDKTSRRDRHQRSMSHSQAPVMSSYSTSIQVQGTSQVPQSSANAGQEILRPESRKDTVVYNVNSQNVPVNGTSASMTAAPSAQQKQHEQIVYPRMPTEHSGSGAGTGSSSRAGVPPGQSSTNMSGNAAATVTNGGIRHDSQSQQPQTSGRASLEGPTNPYSSTSVGFGKDVKREAFVLGAVSSSGNGATGSGAISGGSIRQESRQSGTYSRASQSQTLTTAMAMGSAPPITRSDSSRDAPRGVPSKYDNSPSGRSSTETALPSNNYISSQPRASRAERERDRDHAHSSPSPLHSVPAVGPSSSNGPTVSSASAATTAGPGMSAWHPSATRTHVVSIHAAQGPPDRSSSTVPERAPSRAGHSRGAGGSGEHSSSRAGPSSANSTPSSATHHYFIPRPEVLNLPPGERLVTPTVASSSILSPQTFAVNQMMSVPSSSSSNHQMPMDFGRPTSTAPALSSQYAAKGPSHYAPSISSQHGHSPMVPISRNPSTNSHHSPAQAATLQIPSPQHGPIGVPRSVSNNSYSNETVTPRPPSVIAVQPPAPPIASQSSASVYYSAQQSSPASRSSQVPAVSSASNYASATPSSSHPISQTQHHLSNSYASGSATVNHNPAPTFGSAHENASVRNALPPRSSSDNPVQHPHLHSHSNSISPHRHSTSQSQNAHAATAESTHTPTTPSQYHMSSSGMYHNTAANRRSMDQANQAHAERSSSTALHSLTYGSGNSPRMAGPDRSTRLNESGKIADTQPVSSSQFTLSTGSPSYRSQPSSTGATAGSSLMYSSNISSSSTAPAVPPGFTPPTGQPSRAYSQTAGLPVVQSNPIAVSRSQDVAPSTRVPMNGSMNMPDHTPTMASMRMPDHDSPPPLTPSSSPSSLDEVLMTPSSLDPAKGSQPQQITVTMERPETPKRKGGIFGLFRSSSSKSAKEAREQRDEGKESESRRSQVSGPGSGSSSHPQRSEGAKLRSSRHPPLQAPPVLVGAAHVSADNVDVMKLKERDEDVRVAGKRTKPIPAPIVIPPTSGNKHHHHPIPVKLFSNKRYRTVSSASLEALDGTACNTVIGSPTSSMRSPTPGLLTPPLRDPHEATMEWQINEEIEERYRGKLRRRRPGVVFDVGEDENPKDSRAYRRSRMYMRAHQEEDE